MMFSVQLEVVDENFKLSLVEQEVLNVVTLCEIQTWHSTVGPAKCQMSYSVTAQRYSTWAP